MRYNVKDGRLIGAGFQGSPHSSGALHPSYIVLHHTAGGTMASAASWFANHSSGVSAHIIIGRDGSVLQMVPFDVIAYHAGESYWKGLRGMNKYAVGIELVGWGPLTKREERFFSWTGKEVSSEEVFEGRHKNGGKQLHWHVYTPEQVNSCADVCLALMDVYPIQGVIGHDDVAPGRKVDPGPAFPWDILNDYLKAGEQEEMDFAKGTPLSIPVKVEKQVKAPLGALIKDINIALTQFIDAEGRVCADSSRIMGAIQVALEEYVS